MLLVACSSGTGMALPFPPPPLYFLLSFFQHSFFRAPSAFAIILNGIDLMDTRTLIDLLSLAL